MEAEGAGSPADVNQIGDLDIWQSLRVAARRLPKQSVREDKTDHSLSTYGPALEPVLPGLLNEISLLRPNISTATTGPTYRRATQRIHDTGSSQAVCVVFYPDLPVPMPLQR